MLSRNASAHGDDVIKGSQASSLYLAKTLKDLFPLPKKQSLFYLFDWGDEWVFKISPSRKRPHEPVKRVKYPRVESKSGIKPVQYPGN